MDDFTAGILSVCLVIAAVCLLVAVTWDERACEKQHNVYDCEMIWVPAEDKP